MKALTRSPAYPSGLRDLVATAETDAATHPLRSLNSTPPGTTGTQKPPGKSVAGGPLAGLSKTGLSIALPERAIPIHRPAAEDLSASAGLLPHPYPSATSPDAIERALQAAFWKVHGTPSYAERLLLNRLRSHRPAVPQPCILFTDPNKDPDDVVAFTLGKPLQVYGLVNMTHAVATLGEREVRARRADVARGVFDQLGLPDVRVSVGRDYDIDPLRAEDHAKFLEAGKTLYPKLKTPTKDGADVPKPPTEDSVDALRNSLTQATEKVTLVVIAGMTDPGALVTAEPDLVKQKVGRVVIMGGVLPEKDQDGYVQPDARAYNNLTDRAAASLFYRRVQELGIPLRVVTREAAYRAAVPRTFYENAAQSGHPVGEYLQTIQKHALGELWDSIDRGLIPKLDKVWFFNTFIAPASGHGDAAAWAARNPTFDQIWEQVTRLNLYDPMTLLAAVEESAQMLFSPKTVQAEDRSRVEVIGADEVLCAENARQLMSALTKVALADAPDAPDAPGTR
ncbi:type III secretion system effector XopQ [Ralstonia solanacearum]|uniref:type III secretion system effector XopQ n=1 Tax=Ralstonia solanacearum TaxID=305 RepID=UPI000508BF42|nr:type III secretion system effector XopQ [Ralstonia solanacearum]KFX27601.1 type III effector [Ralstonia solanacearum]